MNYAVPVLFAEGTMPWLIGILALAILAAILAVVLYNYASILIQAYASNANIGLFSLIGMDLRRVDKRVVVQARIMAVQAGIAGAGEGRHHPASRCPLPGRRQRAECDQGDYRGPSGRHRPGFRPRGGHRSGRPRRVGRRANQRLSEGDRLPRSQTLGQRTTLSAIARNGVELKVRARVTVRTNIEQLIGGATEETIIARVGEGIITAIGSSTATLQVMENPDRISKAVLKRGLDSQTAFEIVSIDIADIDVGENIGARFRPTRPRPTRASPGPRRRSVGRWPRPASRK